MSLRARFDIRGLLGLLGRWIILAQVRRTSRTLTDDLRHYVETGTPSPRRQRSLAAQAATLRRADLTTEAMRLARMLHRAAPGDREVAGLLALMLLTDARRAARTDADGFLVPLAEQHRDRWDTAMITEGLALITATLGTGPVGPYQIQAAITAVQGEAPTAEVTDWPQILALYEILETVAPGPAVTLSRAVALAMVHGPKAGLTLLGLLDTRHPTALPHRRDAVRAHLLERAGDPAAAQACYLRAARATASLPEQRYLIRCAARLAPPDPVTAAAG